MCAKSVNVFHLLITISAKGLMRGKGVEMADTYRLQGTDSTTNWTGRTTQNPSTGNNRAG